MCKEYINRIKIALAEQNKTNRWLAEKTGKSDITISRWVQNKTQPSLEQLVEIAKACVCIRFKIFSIATP